MQQNFIKMIDKSINDFEADQKFVEQVEESYKKTGNEDSGELPYARHLA